MLMEGMMRLAHECALKEMKKVQHQKHEEALAELQFQRPNKHTHRVEWNDHMELEIKWKYYPYRYILPELETITEREWAWRNWDSGDLNQSIALGSKELMQSEGKLIATAVESLIWRWGLNRIIAHDTIGNRRVKDIFLFVHPRRDDTPDNLKHLYTTVFCFATPALSKHSSGYLVDIITILPRAATRGFTATARGKTAVDCPKKLLTARHGQRHGRVYLLQSRNYGQYMVGNVVLNMFHYSNSAINSRQIPNSAKKVDYNKLHTSFKGILRTREASKADTSGTVSVGTEKPFHGRDGRVLRAVLRREKSSTARDGYPCHGCRGTVTTATGGSPNPPKPIFPTKFFNRLHNEERKEAERAIRAEGKTTSTTPNAGNRPPSGAMVAIRAIPRRNALI
ncbi:hypothetical protein C8J57DRAFT_1214103 [Mycena rebaudengoi]|nr:hypothetical protein C8J57DRAFT_1214103 [Mycena rebaudengoi]